MDEADVRARLAAQLPARGARTRSRRAARQRGHARGARGRGRGPVGVVWPRARPEASRARIILRMPFARSCSMRGRRSSTPRRRSRSCSRVCSPAPDIGAIPTRCSRPRAACSTGSPRPRATTSCGRPARSDPSASGRACTRRCSRSSASASTSRCATSCTRPSPIPRTTRCSTTCSSRSTALEADGLALGIVSNFEAWLEDLLGALGVRRPVPRARDQRSRGRREAGRARSSHLALQRLGADAADAVYVGDNPEFDVEPARAARDDAGADRPAWPVPGRGLRPDHGPAAPGRGGGRAHDDDADVHRRPRRTPSLRELRERLPRLRDGAPGPDRLERADRAMRSPPTAAASRAATGSGTSRP